MSRMIPISELPTREDVDEAEAFHSANALPPVIWDFGLPPTVDTARLQLNLSALRRLHVVGALSSSVICAYQGETTSFTPGVSGVNSNGTAIASSAGTLLKAEKSKSDLIELVPIPPMFAGQVGKPIAVHRINKAEMAQNISQAIRETHKSKEEAWAEGLSDSLHHSFRNLGKQHLLHHTHRAGRYVDYALYGVLGFAFFNHISQGNPSLSGELYTPASWLALQSMRTIMDASLLKKMTGYSRIDEKRWSLFAWGHQADRYLALSALNSTTSLIKSRK